MANYKVTEYDITISYYKVNAFDKQDAITKLTHCDLATKLGYCAKKIDAIKKKYIAKEIINGKERKVINGRTQREDTLTTTQILQKE